MAFGGLVTAMVTPFNPEGEVNYAMARDLARKLEREGTETIVVGGTTGESPTLTCEERSRLLDEVLDAVGGRVGVVVGTGTNCTRDSIALTGMAERAGAQGVMLVTPYYSKPPQAALVNHFKSISSSTRLPVMLYNVPGRTGVNMLPDTLERLWEVPNIVALKEASGNLDQASEIVMRMPPSFSLYSGDDSLTLPLMAIGARGIVSVASHVAGLEIRKMMDDFSAGRVREAQRRHLRLFPLFRALFVTTNPIPVKAALRLTGLDVGGVRQPLCDLTAAEMERLRQAMKSTGIL